jgi:carboxylate-amine ligase
MLTAWLKSAWTRLRRQNTAPVSTLPDINDQLIFASSRHLSLGVEIELCLLDRVTYRPQARVPALIEKLNLPNVHQEAGAHVVELTTNVCNRVQEAETQLRELTSRVNEVVIAEKAALCATGRAVLFRTAEFEPIHTERYDFMLLNRQILHRSFNSMQGLHIHLGMRSAEECVRNHNFFVHFLPHILALSASTPFVDGADTGLASFRAAVAEALPVAGLPYQFSSWLEYQNLCYAMANAGSIIHVKDLWSDLRPCPRFGTLEIRIADMPATLAEAMAITAFVHCLAEWFEEHHGWLDEMPPPNTWRLRDNKWRAMRYGLDARLIVNNMGETRDLRTDILLWIKRIESRIVRHKYEPYIDTLRQMMMHGNSSERQRRILQGTGKMQAVAEFNLREWETNAPLWDEIDRLVRKTEQTAIAAP